MGETGKYGWKAQLKSEFRKYTMKGGVDFPAFYLKITYGLHHKIYNLTFPIIYETLN
jgi:hypothetical protein